MSKKITYEIYWLRCIACLSVVAMHSITSGLVLFSSDSMSLSEYALYVLQMSMMFGTPAFIFISEFLFSKAYPDGLPKGFFKKRLQFLFIPYLAMSVIYGIVFSESKTIEAITVEIIKNAFLGNFVAYFILVIFQFYILHFLLHQKLKIWNPKIVLFVTLFINVLYLGFFNFISPPSGNVAQYIWSRGHWLLLPAWLFYFSLGYYCGKYYEQLLVLLHKYKLLVFAAPFVTLAIVVVLRYLGLPDLTSSKRIDIIFYTTSVIFLIMYISSTFKAAPTFVLFISKYSFSIYLLHKLVVDTVGVLHSNIFVHVLLTFILGIFFAIAVAYLFNMLPYGKYLVGQTATVPKKIKWKEQNEG